MTTHALDREADQHGNPPLLQPARQACALQGRRQHTKHLLGTCGHRNRINDSVRDRSGIVRAWVGEVPCVPLCRLSKVHPQKSTDIRRQPRTKLSKGASARSASCFGTSPTPLSPTSRAAILAPADASCAARARFHRASCSRSGPGCSSRSTEFQPRANAHVEARPSIGRQADLKRHLRVRAGSVAECASRLAIGRTMAGDVAAMSRHLEFNSRGSRENRPTPPRTITGFSCPLWSQATAVVGEKETAFRVAPGPRETSFRVNGNPTKTHPRVRHFGTCRFSNTEERLAYPGVTDAGNQ